MPGPYHISDKIETYYFRGVPEVPLLLTPMLLFLIAFKLS